MDSPLDAIYELIPNIRCKGKCQEYCGPVGMSEYERNRLIQVSGRDPIRRAWVERPPDLRNLVCPILNQRTGKCRAYDVRPAICRLWGAVENLRCPYGCKPDRYLKDGEAHAIFEAIEEIGKGEAGDDAE